MIPIITGGAIAGALAATKGHARLTLSRAKHRSLAGHVRLAKRIAGQIPAFAHTDRFFAVDGAPAEIAARRAAGFDRLASLYAVRFAARPWAPVHSSSVARARR